MLARAIDAYNDYRRWLDREHTETAKAVMRTTLAMMANHDHAHAFIDDHEHEQRLLFIMSANTEALWKEMMK